MPTALNVRAARFAFRELFLAEPMEGYDVPSLSIRDLANRHCQFDECKGMNDGLACRRHTRAMILGGAKMIAEGEVHAEMSQHGVVFVRLTPQAILSPLEWSSPPYWFSERPHLVGWARSRIDPDVRRWEDRV